VREGVLLVLGIAAGLSALFVASDVLSLLLGTGSRKGLTAGLAVAPLLLSAVLVALIRVHAWASPRFAFPVMVLWCALVLALGAVYGLAAYLRAQGWRPRPAAARPLTVPEVLAGGDVDDEEWLQRARAVLRERADLPEARISGALREAQEHAADHGTRLLEE